MNAGQSPGLWFYKLSSLNPGLSPFWPQEVCPLFSNKIHGQRLTSAALSLVAGVVLCLQRVSWNFRDLYLHPKDTFLPTQMHNPRMGDDAGVGLLILRGCIHLTDKNDVVWQIIFVWFATLVNINWKASWRLLCQDSGLGSFYSAPGCAASLSMWPATHFGPRGCNHWACRESRAVRGDFHWEEGQHGGHLELIMGQREMASLRNKTTGISDRKIQDCVKTDVGPGSVWICFLFWAALLNAP